MNVLMLTPYVPYPPSFGGAVRIYNLIRQISRKHTLHLLSMRAPDGGDPNGLRSYAASVTTVLQLDAKKRWKQLRSLFSMRSFQWRQHENAAMQATIHRLVKEKQIDLIVVEFSQMAGFTFPPGVPVVLDEHNVEFDLLNRIAAREVSLARRSYNRFEAAKFRREEIAACRSASMTWVTSTRDGDLLKKYAPELRTALITNGVDCGYFARPDVPRQPDMGVFVGATNYFPNKDGVLFFLREIDGLIRRVRPQFHLKVIGGKPPPAVLAEQSATVDILGSVEDVRPHMWGASVFVVPLRMGGGTRFKIVEAMAAGVPVVTTSLGMEGIPAVHEQDLLVADTPQDFADAVIRVLTDSALSEKLIRNGLDFVRNHFDWSLIGDRVNDALELAVRS